ncbi:MAG: AraC family transcriptional regulator [Betaproteobacteria bacterium]|nr:AraC family transcriptional regulator [Betaproteobacteria bacterium]
MDYLAPLLGHLSLSAKVFFTGKSCQVGLLDGSANVGHLHLVKSGSVTIEVRGERVSHIDRPTVIFFPRPCHHTLIPGETGVELVCATVDLGLAEGGPLAVYLPELVSIPTADMPAIAATLDLLFAEAFSTEIGRQAALDRMMEYFIIHVLRHLIGQGKLSGGVLAAMTDQRLRHAINAMHDRPAHPWTLEELAEVSRMSRARFAANFRNLVGITPLDYLTNWRLSVARGQLRQGRPLKSVARSVGYQSSEALSRVFAKKVGQTPFEWMRDQRNDDSSPVEQHKDAAAT